MSRLTSRRVGLCVALLFALVPLLAAQKPLTPNPSPAEGRGEKGVKIETFTGKVQPLKKVLEKSGIKLDSDAGAEMVLVGDDGKVYLLVRDGMPRMFFKDETLLDRPFRLTGRLVPGSQILQVLEIHSLLKGQPHEVYYWCDVCTIKRFEKAICDCCGGPLFLKEEPVKK